MKKSGSILLETIIAMMLLTIIIPIFNKLIIQCDKEAKRIKDNEEANRIVYCIMQELKYNYSIAELIKAKEKGYLDKKYYYGIIEDMISNDFLMMPTGEDIIIDISNVSDKELNIIIYLKFSKDNVEIMKQKAFLKAEWMEYIGES